MPEVETQITSQDVVQGVILWLPPKPRVVKALESHGLASHQPVANLTWKKHIPEDAFYDHPILVVSRPASKTSRVHFVPVSSHLSLRCFVGTNTSPVNDVRWHRSPQSLQAVSRHGPSTLAPAFSTGR